MTWLDWVILAAGIIVLLCVAAWMITGVSVMCADARLQLGEHGVNETSGQVWQENVTQYEKGGCYTGKTETLTMIPVCENHSNPQVKAPGVKGSWCGGYCPVGTSRERNEGVKRYIEREFGFEQGNQLRFELKYEEE